MCRSNRYIILAMLTAVAAFAQNQPQFDVVSIKPNNTVPNIMETPPLKGGRLNFMHASLKTMIGIAYKMKSFQIEGGPAWAGTDRYDISATSTELSPSEERYRSMLRNMLEDRFQLSAHRESRESTIYGLVAAKNGPKLKAAAPGSCVPLDAEHPAAAPGTRCGSANIMANRLTGTSMTTAGLADVLTNIVGRPVVDKTGVSGAYDIHLDFTRDSTVENTDAPSIFTAIQEQLGLRLESQKGPVEFLVVDHAEKPSAN